jgi:class 3 adenylate cyclase
VKTPETRYAKNDDGLSIAYQTLGEGSTDIILLPTYTCVDVMWEEPSLAHVLRRLARIGRLICFDVTGIGASDPAPLDAFPTSEAFMEDTRAVLDAVGSTTAHLVCHGGSGFLGMLFAATYGERTNTLTLLQSFARLLRAEDYPCGAPSHVFEGFKDLTAQRWGTGANVDLLAPSKAGDDTFCRWWGRSERAFQSPAQREANLRWFAKLDVRSILPAIRVPTLVLHREDDRVSPPDYGRYLADHIPDAQLVTVPGTDNMFFTQGADEIVDHIEEFITGAPPVREPDRVLATVLFTDFVDSTGHAARLGDKKWRQLLDRHDTLVARELERHRGRKVNPTGDGILATFDGPARAVRCAQSIVESVKPLGIEVRAGLHTGEVELRGEDIGGIAVHIGQRVSALAAPGEVVVSSTVVDLVAGSGLAFEDRGEHELKGVPRRWRVYVVR